MAKCIAECFGLGRMQIRAPIVASVGVLLVPLAHGPAAPAIPFLIGAQFIDCMEEQSPTSIQL